MRNLTSTICLTIAALLSGCITTSTENYVSPSGKSTHETKCNVSKFKCLKEASTQCNGPYEVLSSDSHAGGILADWVPGPVTWHTMTYECGQSDGRQPRRENAQLKEEKKRNQSEPKQVAKTPSPEKSPPPKSGSTGSGFFISKSGHILTNQHAVADCTKVTVGDNTKKQVTADVLETDRRNDLALLRISNMKMTSIETKSLIQKLGVSIVPLASDGLMRSGDVELGEDVLVAGYPYGEVFSDTIKVTKGIVSATRGIGDDTGQFQIDAAVQPGNSGGPIYDENGNIVGVVVSQLNKMKFAEHAGSIPENVNFGIKASTVSQFLNTSGLPTKWSERSEKMSTSKLAQIAKNQTVMVMCYR